MMDLVTADPVSHQPGKAVSARALDRHGVRARANKLQRIYDVIRDAQLRGVPDMTGAEIVAAYERKHAERIETGRVAARLSELIAANRVDRRPLPRICTVTGYEARPVFCVAHQAPLT